MISHRQIEAFRATMRTGGVTRAARMLNVTQPAVTRLLRDFERAVGLALFDRVGNQLAPTAEAAALLDEVERSFVGLSRIADYAASLRLQSAGSLRIAAMPALAGGALTRFTAHFARERPGLRISISGMPSHLVLDAVISGLADVGYADFVGDHGGLEILHREIAAVAIAPEGHRFARKRRVTPADFAGERFVGLGSGTLFRARVDALMAGVERELLLDTPLSQVACLLVAEGAGVGVVDAYSAAEFVGRGLVAKPFEPRLDAGFVALRSTARPRSRLADGYAREFDAYMAKRFG